MLLALFTLTLIFLEVDNSEEELDCLQLILSEGKHDCFKVILLKSYVELSTHLLRDVLHVRSRSLYLHH